MKIKELRNKTQEELKKLYNELCVNRQEIGFKLAGKQHKNVSEMRNLKKTVARILTLLKENK